MRFGLEIIPFGEYADPRKVVELARAAEAAGWEGIWLWDHLLMPYGAGDPWVTLTAVAAVTQRLIVLPGVAALPRYHPEILARLLAGLDIFSGGRLVLGAGMGALKEEFTAFSGPGEMRTRAEMLDEGLEVITRLWSGEKVDFQGRHYTVNGAALNPQPLQQPRVPVWIGGDKPPALRRAARWDGWIIGIIDEQGRFTRSPEQLAEDVAYIRQHREAGEPFEVAVDGISQPGENERVRAYAEAGATWWFEAIYGLRGSHEQMLARIEAGPPEEEFR